MLRMNRRLFVRSLLVGLVIGIAILSATAAPPAPPPPPVSITLCSRDAHAWPATSGFTHTGGGNIDVQQPTPDTLVITMTGVAVAGAHPIQNSIAQMAFHLCQAIVVKFDDPKVKRAQLTMEGRVSGLLRSHKGGGLAAISEARATVMASGNDLLSIEAPEHSVSNGQHLSVNDLCACESAQVGAGPLVVHQRLCISATHPRTFCPKKAASAEFAPEPALDPQWISYWEPFHGAAKKEFGFQVIIRVSDDTGNTAPTTQIKTIGHVTKK